MAFYKIYSYFNSVLLLCKLISKKMMPFRALLETKGEDPCTPSSSLEIVTMEVFSNLDENSTSLFSSTFSYVTSCCFLIQLDDS
jgi:hypothetical protein